MITVGLGTLDGEAAAVGVDSQHVVGARTRPSMCCGSSGPAELTVSCTAVSSSRSTTSIFPKPLFGCTADPHRWILACSGSPQALDRLGDGVFSGAAPSRRLNAPPNWTSCGPMPCAPVEIRRRCSTPAGDRSISPQHGWTVLNGDGVDRVVVSPSIDRVQVQLDDLSAFAQKHLSA